MKKDTRGDSSIQRTAEGIMRAAVEKKLKIGPLASAIIQIKDGVKVEVDAVTEDKSVLIEIFARQGKLLDGQKKKIAKDMLKLALLGVDIDGKKRRLIIAHANPAITGHLKQESWISCAAEKFGIEELDISDDLPPATKAELLEAQAVQGHFSRD
ncbi:MAG: hypothetical protein ACSHX4_02355 [Opitutaceae bacterium]